MINMPGSDDAIGKRIAALHDDLVKMWPSLTRMAISIYDQQSDQLNTFVCSSTESLEMESYGARLSEVPSLDRLAQNRQHRIINDTSTFAGSESPHSQWLISSGFRSSFTIPLYKHDTLLGFLFFNSLQKNYFVGQRLSSLKVYAELIEALLLNELAAIDALRGAINTTQFITHQRHSETAAHIMRMSHYAHLIARHLAPKLNLKDDYVEYILQYAPLHDVGKIGIMDDLLLKPGKLTAQEFEEIKQHVDNGLRIIDTIVHEFNLGHFEHLEILYNIIGSHHEKVDGSGYPKGLKGDDIPLEGRIIAVADVLDALTNPRVYKKAWSFEDSIAYLQAHAGSHFDPVCVQAVADNREDFQAVCESYKER